MKTPTSELEAAGRDAGGHATDAMRRIVDSLQFGLAETQGKRDSMEDTHVALVSSNLNATGAMADSYAPR